MLRKENRTFLEIFWKLYPSKTEKEQKEKFEKRSISQIANRIVKQTNDAIVDIAFVLEKLPDKYREKINIEQGFNLFNDRIIQSTDKNAKLRLGRKQFETGIKMIKEEIKDDELLKMVYEQKLNEIETLVKLLVKSRTRLIEKPKNKSDLSFDEMNLGHIANKVRKK